MKVRIEIETTDIFNFTNSSREDSKIVEELLSSLEDEPLIQEVINRGLVVELFDSISSKEQEAIIENYAEEHGYVKQED